MANTLSCPLDRSFKGIQQHAKNLKESLNKIPKSKTSNLKLGTANVDAIKNVIDTIKNYRTNSKGNIIFNPTDHSYTIRTTEGEIKADYSVTEWGEQLFGKPNIKGDYSHSQVIGTSIDEYGRAYFGKKNIKSEKEFLDYKELKNQFDDIKNELKKIHGEEAEFITEELPMVGYFPLEENGELKNVFIGGTPDLIVIDNLGKVHIYDFKVKKKEALEVGSDDLINYAYQQNAYSDLFKANTGIEVKSVNLIWFHTNYPKGTAGKGKDYKVEDSKILYKKEPLQNNEEWKQPTFKKIFPLVKEEVLPDLKSLTKGKGNINTKNPILTNKSNKKITIGTRNVTKESVRSEENKNKAFVFTENLQALSSYTEKEDIHSLFKPVNDKYLTEKKDLKLDVNGINNQSNIRAYTENKVLHIIPNTFGIITKWAQQYHDGKFINNSQGNFEDSDLEFEEFKTANTYILEKLENSNYEEIVFPDQMALGKSALPRRFTEWLQEELRSRFGVDSKLKYNKNMRGWGLRLTTTQERAMEFQYEGNMSFKFGKNKRNGVEASSTIEAIIEGKRTATTRYEKEGNLDYWKNVKKGDIIRFHDEEGRAVYVRATEDAKKLTKTSSAKKWSEIEGWSEEYFKKQVKPKLEGGEKAIQIEFEYVMSETGTISQEEYLKQLNDKKENEKNIKQLEDKKVSFSREEGKEGNRYAVRTETNIKKSDITIAFANNWNTAGEQVTEKLANENKKPYVDINILKSGILPVNIEDKIDEIVKAITKLKKDEITINIAGNGIYTLNIAGISQEQCNNFVYTVLHGVQSKLKKSNSKIKLNIRSGGQTGADEAGIVAAMALKLPSTVHTTKKWKFRNIKDEDVSNEKEFIERFSNSSTPELIKEKSVYEDDYELLVEKHMQYTDAVSVDLTDSEVNVELLKASLFEKIKDKFEGVKMDINTLAYLYQVTKAIVEARNADVKNRAEFKDIPAKELNTLRNNFAKDYYNTLIEHVSKGEFNAIEKIKSKDNPCVGLFVEHFKKDKKASLEAIKENIKSHAKDLEERERRVNAAKESEDNLVVNEDSYISKIEEIYHTFDPETLKKRTAAIASSFRRIFDKKLRSLNKNLIKTINDYDTKSKNKENIPIEEFNNYVNAKELLLKISDPINGQVAALNALDPKKIFKDVKAEFENDIERCREGLKEAEEKEDEENIFLLERRMEELEKFIDNFDTLTELSISDLEKTMQCRFTEEEITNTSDEAQEEEEENEEAEEDSKGVVRGNDGWSYKARLREGFNTASKKVKELLGKVYKCDYNGNPIEDDMGVFQTESADYQHRILTEIFAENVIESKDFAIKTEENGKITYDFPVLEKYKSKYPWIQDIIERLRKDPSLVATFYSDFRQDYYNVTIFTYDKKEKKYKIFSANDRHTGKAASEVVINNWLDNRIITKHIKDSIYDNTGVLNYDRVNYIISTIEKFQDDSNSLREGEAGEFFHYIGKNKNQKVPKKGTRNEMARILQSMGVSADSSSLGDMDSFEELMKEINTIVLTIQKDKMTEAKDVVNGKHKDLYVALKKLPILAGAVDEFAIRPTFYESGQTYPNYATPNNVSTLCKTIRNTEKREKFLEKLKQVDFLYDKKNGKFKSKWFRDLAENMLDFSVMFDYSEIFKINNKTYDKWTRADKQLGLMSLFYFKEGEGTFPSEAWYRLPLFSDSQTCMLIKQQTYSTEECVEYMAEVALQELDRMAIVEKREKLIKNGEVKEIANYDANGHRFHFLPELNDLKLDCGKTLKGVAVLIKEGKNKENGLDKSLLDYAKEAVEKVMEGEVKKYVNSISEETAEEMFKYLEQEGYLTEDMSEASKEYLSIDNNQLLDSIWSDSENDLEIPNPLYEYIKYYQYNNLFAQSQIYMLTITDLAYYANMTEVQKRFKQEYASGRRPFTQSKYGKETERVIYLKDSKKASRNYDKIKKLGVDPELVDAFLSINTTDAQAYRTITSYRSVQDMFGNWDEVTMNPAMERLLKGEATVEDLNVIWQIVKPFLEENIVVPDGLGGYLRVKHQHKNSEFLLLAMHDHLNNILNQSSKLKGLNEFMEENNIDCAMFNSAVKSGCQGVIDIRYSEKEFEKWLESEDATEAIKEADKTSETFTYDDLLKYYTNKLKKGEITQVDYNKTIDSFEPDAEEVYKMLSKEVFKDDENGNEVVNPEVVHEFSYENYREAQPNPEHLLDSESTIGSQWGNYIISDLPKDIEITLEGKKFNKEGIVKLYNWLRLEDSIQGYAEAKKIFENKETLHKELVRLIQTNPNYSLDLLNALELVEEEEQIEYSKKNFRMPLVTPSMLNSTVSMLFSIFRNKISKPTIKGGAAVLVSSFGFYDAEHKKGGYKAPRIVYEKGKVKAVQCYLPAYSKQMYEPFLNKDTKTLDFTKMPEELRIAIGYRIPTEDKYSMLPLEIIGFLPPQNGSAIVIPEEIVTIAGIDFDVDKAFLMRHEFRVKTTYNFKEMFRDFYAEEPNLLNEIENIRDDIWGDIITDESLSEGEQEALYFKKLKETSMFKRLIGKGFKVDGLFETWKKGQNMSKYIESISVEKIKYNINEDPKDMTKAQRHNLLIDLSFAILTSKDVAKDYHTIGNFDQLIKAGRIVEILSDASKIIQILDETGIKNDGIAFYNYLKSRSIKELNSYFEKDTDNPLSDLTYDKYHHQNMQGAALISPYAIGGTAQAKYQHTELALTVPIKYNGREIESLHDIYIDDNPDNPRISEALSQLKAASVDNAKNPQLYKIMQNPETAYIAVFMTYLGMSIEDIALVFNSPGIKNLIEEEGTLENISTLIENTSNKEKEEILEEYNPTSLNLVDGIIRDTSYRHFNPENYDWHDFVNKNFTELMVWMENLIEQAQSIRYLNSCTRSDSPNGSLASTLSKAQIQKMKIDKLEENTPALEGASAIVRNDIAEKEDSIEEIREKLRNCKLPFLQGTYTLGIDLPLKIMKTYIPHLRDNVYKQVLKLDSLSPRKTVTPKVLNEFYKGLTSYVLAGAIPNYNDTRIHFIEEFPSEFAEYRKTGAFRHLPIIQSMSFNKKGEIVCDINSASSSAVQEYTKNLDSLLFSGKEGIDLAKKLFLYSYFKDGVDFTPTSYGKCFSTLFWNKMTTFMNELRNMEEDEDRDYSEYLELFIINHFHENNVIKEKIVEEKEFNKLQEGMQITIESTDEFYAIKTIEGETVKLAKLIKTHKEEKGNELSSYIITEHEKELYNSYYDYYEGEETDGEGDGPKKVGKINTENPSNETLAENGKIYSEPMCE